MSAEWIDPTPVQVPDELRIAVGGPLVLSEALVRRGVKTPSDARAFLDPSAYSPSDPFDLPDIATAVRRIYQAARQRERVAVWGDFDADGQTATALLVETLQSLDIDVVSHIPSRDEGHGLHNAGVQHLVNQGVRLILTCDTGVTAHQAVLQANSLGTEVIITDHHMPADFLPRALAIVNPLRLPNGHRMQHLAGVGVAYQLARALNPAAADQALDLVALGTVADLAALTGENRYLVQQGLERLRNVRRLGLRAVLEVAELRPEGITEEHIGYVLGPRLNSVGRLADASKGVELLLTADPVRARTLATEMEGLNARRQWLTKQITDAALKKIEREPSLLSDYAALVLSDTSWPPGVTGVVAGRLARLFDKPTVLIATPTGQLARGSARSLPGIDLIAVLTDCSPVLRSFGGHRGAAGFSLYKEQIPELRAAMSRAVAARTESAEKSLLAIDAYVELNDLTLEFAAEIARLAPFGRGNPPLALAVRDLRLLGEAVIGRTGEHRRLTVEDRNDQTQTVLWWLGATEPLPQGRFDLALTARTSDFSGAQEIQLEWLDSREISPTTAEIRSEVAFEVQDCRTASDPLALLQALVTEGDTEVWSEGQGPVGLEAQTRLRLEHSRRLAVWSLPPGPRELSMALLKVRPDEVFLFAHDPGLDELPAFLSRLAGMVRFALRANDGLVNLEEAAAAMAHRRRTIEVGLEWLAVHGKIAVLERGLETWRLSLGQGTVNEAEQAEVGRRLDSLLAETAAYRAHFRQAPAETLLTSVFH